MMISKNAPEGEKPERLKGFQIKTNKLQTREFSRIREIKGDVMSLEKPVGKFKMITLCTQIKKSRRKRSNTEGLGMKTWRGRNLMDGNTQN
ncbi:hypothetical protein Phum_PHUM231420 [Pediculus humanus corporis]|uniref:Uncharacterized protein n=1 Tax=Pediculus humanus subsp. corporis TaxID=121224 RepID=E0VIR0_PEDHC|nr:uncharacterized protein Phum_PHUM231420 [Pediculus humanus corporis]EEB13266.1 hypothetical protein Phum_PHUM231420 [Pediculus humanus corporis]